MHRRCLRSKRILMDTIRRLAIMNTDKRMRIHFSILYFLILVYIILGTGPFSGKFFNSGMVFIYLFLVTIFFSILFGYSELIIESIRIDDGRWKAIATGMILSFLIALVFPLNHNYKMPTWNFNDLQVAFFEEIVFRSALLGLALKIGRINAERPIIRDNPLPIYSISEKIIRTYVLVALLSLAFSLFHFWDLAPRISGPDPFWKPFIWRATTGFLFNMLFIWSGKKIYPPIFLHYINNNYAP